MFFSFAREAVHPKAKEQMMIMRIRTYQAVLLNGCRKLVQEKASFGFFRKKVKELSSMGIVKSTTVDLR